MLTFAAPLQAQLTRAEFRATRGEDVVRGYFEWSPTDPIWYSIRGSLGSGKNIWRIAGGMSLNGFDLFPMTSVSLEVINNFGIAAPSTFEPNTQIGDQITFFGTADVRSGLQSVQNVYFRDETGLLLTSIVQPTTQAVFDQFSSSRIDLFRLNGEIQTFQLEEWRIVSNVAEPSTVWLCACGLLALAFLSARRRMSGP